MQPYQEEFITFAIEQGVLKFGEFVLKSGRRSPWFFNSGLFKSGKSLARLGHYYGEAIVNSRLEFDILFGPAYKGIPLVAATAIALANDHGLDTPYVFNRKEAKDHGEGGTVVGAPLHGHVLIIDDVISAGTSVRESVSIIKAHGATPCGVSIALDRQEKGLGELSAVEEVEKENQLPVCVIANLSDLLNYIQQKPELAHTLLKVQAYREKYGR